MAKILIADDEPDFCLLLKTRLAPLQHTIITAADGQEALDKIIQEKPDLLILDVIMPKLTGFQLVQKLNALPVPLTKMSIIVMSGNHRMKDFFDSWKTVAFLPKPFEPEELLLRVNQAFNIYTPPPANKAASLENLKKEPPGTEDGKKKKVLAVGKSEFAINKAKEFMESLGLSVSVELEDKFAIEVIKSSNFDFILCQFWEDPKIFNAVEVYNKVQEMPHLRNTVFALFCLNALIRDAKQAIEKIPVIPFEQTDELKTRLHEVLKKKAIV